MATTRPTTSAHGSPRRPAGEGSSLFSPAVLLALAAGGIGLFWDGGLHSGPRFSRTSDAEVQIRELQAYVEGAGLEPRVLQVQLESFPKVSQFSDIDSSRNGYGRNACGLVAAATALGGDAWPALLSEIAAAAGDAYQPHAGIQPSPFTAALRGVVGWRAVSARDHGSLGELYRALARGDAVIVDIKVSDDQAAPSSQPPTVAHFARVLGMDTERAEIYLANTLDGPAYWTVPLVTFMAAWELPETSATLILDPEGAEAVDRWAVFVSPGTPPGP